MTVTYTAEVASCREFIFLKLLSRWRGSIYKLVVWDLVAFLLFYYGLSLSYRYLMDPEAKSIFENVVFYCREYTSLIPLSFVLGFYVAIIMGRWWAQYMTIPWPDSTAVYVSAHIHGEDDRGRLIRRTVMRYVCLSLTMIFIMIAPNVKKRFPTLTHLVEAGLLLEKEKAMIGEMDEAFPKHPKYWLPIMWTASIVTRARRENRIRDDLAMKTILDEVTKFRANGQRLTHYFEISMPLVYTQVVTLAVYSYFFFNGIGQQWTEGTDADVHSFVNLYFPIFSALQFFFFMGWLKVAEVLINPFGDDDDDFELNWMIDRNLRVSYIIVDEMHHEHPQLVRDQYWDEVFPMELPYNQEVDAKREKPPVPSTARLVKSKQFLSQSLFAVDVQKSAEVSSVATPILVLDEIIDQTLRQLKTSQTSLDEDGGDESERESELLEEEEEEVLSVEDGDNNDFVEFVSLPEEEEEEEEADEDDFEQLRMLRQKERRERQRRRYARSLIRFSTLEGDKPIIDSSEESEVALTSRAPSLRWAKGLRATERSEQGLVEGVEGEREDVEEEDVEWDGGGEDVEEGEGEAVGVGEEVENTVQKGGAEKERRK